MAITRLWQSGFEAGSNNELSTVTGDVGANFGVVSSDSYTGSYSLGRSNTVGDDDYAVINIPSTYQVRLGAFFKNTGTQFHNDTLRSLFVFRNGTTEIAFMRVQNIDWYIHANGSQRDSAIGQHIQNTWFHIGIDLKIDASGWMYFYKNGVELMSWSGNTGSSQVDNILLSNRYNPLGATSGWIYIDDVYIDDTTGEGAAAPLDLLRFYWASPDGNGNYNSWVGSDADSTDNYLLLDERPPSDSDYIETATVDQYDSHATTSAVTLATGQTIQAVIPIARAQRNGNTEQLALGTRYSSTDSIGSDQDVAAGSPDYVWERQTTKPGGGAWDQTSIDGFEVVTKSRGSY